MNEIRRSVLLRAPIALVWDYLTQADKIALWLMPNDFEPVSGHNFTMQCDPAMGSGSQIQAEVLEIDPPRRLVYSWLIEIPPLETVLSIDLTEDDAGTRLDLVHSGWAGLASDQGELTSRHEMGWDFMLNERLPAALKSAAKT